MPEARSLAAHAKLNVFLRVLAREEDGWHGLETLFSLIDLHDTLVAEPRPAGRPTLVVEGDTDLGPVEANLVVRAAELVLEACGRPTGVHFHLTKRIPVGAGLGGGSSDAAAALLLTNQLAGNPIPGHELLQFAARLGSDVPFLLGGGPTALAWGHGERMLRLPPLPASPALLVVSPEGVRTPEAYGWVDGMRQTDARRGAVQYELASLATWGGVGRLAGNDFEAAVFSRRPGLRDAFEALARTHPLICRMTGSGSTLFAVYRSEGARDDAVLQLGRRHGRVLPVQTLAHPVR